MIEPQTPPEPQTTNNEEATDLSPALTGWYHHVHQMSKAAGIRPESMFAHSMSMAAALIGHLASRGDGVPVSLPLLMISREAPPPLWMQREWLAMERLDDCQYPDALEHHATRARNKRLAPLIAAANFELPGTFSIQEMLYAKRLCFGRVAITHGTGRLAAASHNLPLTHLAATLPRVRAVWRRLAAGHDQESFIGCLSPDEARKLLRQSGDPMAGQAGWIMPIMAAPAPEDEPAQEEAPPRPISMTDHLFKMALKARQDQGPYVLSPPPVTLSHIRKHLELRHAAFGQTPEALHPMIPDDTRYMDMTALLAALCPASENPEQSTYTAAAFAARIDFMCMRLHLDFIRRHFPADDRGMFEGHELAVFRQLGGRPQSIRDIQRCMKGISAKTCREALERAANAGLAEESGNSRFQISDEGPRWLEAWVMKTRPPVSPPQPVTPPPAPKPVPVPASPLMLGRSLDPLRMQLAMMG